MDEVGPWGLQVGLSYGSGYLKSTVHSILSCSIDLVADKGMLMERIVLYYLKALFHQIDQAGFKVTADMKAVQVARMKFLSSKLRIVFQVSLPLALINSGELFFGTMFGQSRRVSWGMIVGTSD